MSGRVARDATTVVKDPAEAQSVYARGFFGTFKGESLNLDRYETVYLAEMSRLAFHDTHERDILWSELFRRAATAERDFGIRYIVYRDLRQRGYVVRASPPPVAFSVLPRGGTLHKTPARYWVEPFSERAAFDLERIHDLAARAQGAKKLLLLAVVDEESDLTYYRIRRPVPTGSLEPQRLPHPATGWLSKDRVVVFDPDAVELLGHDLGYGSRIGARLELSLIEAAYLAEDDQLTLTDSRGRQNVALETLVSRAQRLDARFAERLRAYRTLRERHLVVKTGFKYGAHFRAYPRRPEHTHARYLVQAVPSDHRGAWPDIAGAVRVAQGVRKDLLVAGVPREGNVTFLALERIRP
ncbi:MAG: tRNA-intron lyase [Thermoplasmata archaeon]